VSDREIFDAALAFADPAQRSAYLDQACAGDAALKKQIEGLLDMHAQLGSFLESPAVAEGMTVDQPASPERPGTVIGLYKLLQQIGEGGMGTVWMAEQTQPVQRKVALKIIKAGMDSRHVLARFEAERQALALMDHPNIAKVLDAGAIGEPSDVRTIGEPSDVSRRVVDAPDTRRLTPLGSPGRPYFVMELVKGQPITQYCDQHRLTPKERLELFVPVCQAIQHAHQKGIIHRDIKPSNVLVGLYDGRPVTKVIDFGVAKAAGPKLTEKTLYTEFGQVVGTLEYMSPEQAQLDNFDIDTRSDIYALGVLLYELLTGTTPLQKQRLKQAALLEVLRLIREEEPPRPSTRLSTKEELPSIAANRGLEPRKLSGLVRGELDWIVMKALEKDRNRRYETANGFAMDIQRYLADEPVQACPPSARYRLGKFARRHKVAFAMISVVSALLVLSVLILAISNVRIQKERQQTTANLRLALKALDEIYLQVAEVRLPRDPARKKEDQELLKKALGFYQQFADANSSQSPVRLEVTRAHRRAGDIQRFIGDHAAAQEAYRLALVPAQELATEFRDEPEYGYELAMCHNALAEELLETDQTPAASEHFRQAIELLTKLAADYPGVPEYWAALARTYHGLGKLHKQQGERSAGEASFQQALDIQSKLSAEFPAIPQYRVDLAEIHSSAGFWMEFGGLYATTEEVDHIRHACELLSKLVADFPDVPLYRQRLAGSLRQLAVAPREVSSADQIKRYEQAIFHFTKLAADFPQVPDYRAGLATCYGNLGLVYYHMGDWAGHAKYTRKSLDLVTELVAKYPTVTEYKERLAVELDNMAGNLVSERELSEGRKLLKDALTHMQALHKSYPDSPRYPSLIVYSNYFLADIDASLGQSADGPRLRQEADKVFDETWKGLRAKRGPSSAALFCADVARSFGDLAKTWKKAGNHEQMTKASEAAIKAFDQATKLHTQNGQQDPKFAQACIAQGLLYSDLGQLDKAITAYSKAIEFDPNNPWAWSNLGLVYQALGEWDKAIANYSKAIALSPDHATSRNNLAWLLATCPDANYRDPKRADELAKKAVDLAPEEGNHWNTLGVAHYSLADFKASIAALEKSMGLRKGGDSFDWFFLAMAHWQLVDKQEARKWYDKAVQWMEKKNPQDDELRRFRAEAEELLGIAKPVNPEPELVPPPKVVGHG
jgi:serine/threonine protein kinase/Tfp pilus assembly protein PilF